VQKLTVISEFADTNARQLFDYGVVNIVTVPRPCTDNSFTWAADAAERRAMLHACKGAVIDKIARVTGETTQNAKTARKIIRKDVK
jgi:hypothetical protein